MKKYSLFAGIMAVALLFGCSKPQAKNVSGKPDVGGAYSQMYEEEFWTSDMSDEVIMDAESIKAYHERMKNTGIVWYGSLADHSSIILEEDLKKRITAYTVPYEDRYTGEKGETLLTKAFFNKIDANRNLSAIGQINEIKYGIIVNETSLRDFPDDTPVYEERGNMDIDLFYENRMKVWEKCIILHTSLDKAWYYVQCKTFSGWIKAKDTAVCSRQQWLSYDGREFLTVTGNRIVLDADPYDSELSRKELTMGTYLPLAEDTESVNNVSVISSYTVLLPGRDVDGNLTEKSARVPKGADVHKGYLSYTEKNVISQAFKMLGERYGWGGSLYARDCSTFIRDIYFCFGIDLPRNSAAQGKAASTATISAKALSDSQKEKLITEQRAGTILEMQGHVMLYLGEYKGKAYIIHDVYAFGESGKFGENGRKTINCVTVSDLYVTRKDGTMFLSDIRNISPIEYDSK